MLINSKTYQLVTSPILKTHQLKTSLTSSTLNPISPQPHQLKTLSTQNSKTCQPHQLVTSPFHNLINSKNHHLKTSKPYSTHNPNNLKNLSTQKLKLLFLSLQNHSNFRAILAKI
jgi:hypothetical protein